MKIEVIKVAGHLPWTHYCPQSLKTHIVAAKNFKERSTDSNKVNAGNTNYIDIQEFFWKNMPKVDLLKNLIFLHDIIVTLMIMGLLCSNADA